MTIRRIIGRFSISSTDSLFCAFSLGGTINKSLSNTMFINTFNNILLSALVFQSAPQNDSIEDIDHLSLMKSFIFE